MFNRFFTHIPRERNTFVNFQVSFFRYFCSLKTSNLAVLRKRTGLAFSLCKKALEIHNNDLEKAELWLKEESIKKGYEKSSRILVKNVQGLVASYIDNTSKRGTLVELTCQTDFVSRNQIFIDLLSDITLSLAQATQIKTSRANQNQFRINRYKIANEDFSVFNDKISTCVTKLGEKINISRALLIQAEPPNEDIKLFTYSHFIGDKIEGVNQVNVGKYSAILFAQPITPVDIIRENEIITHDILDNVSKSEKELNPRELSENSCQDTINEMKEVEELFCQERQLDRVSFDLAGKIICQHIVGLNPKYLKKSDEQLEKEKELKEQGFKIPSSNEFLLDQRLLIDESLSVAQYSNFNGVKIVDFVRFECGEESF